MKFGALVCLCVVTLCGITAAGGNGPEVVEEGHDVFLPCSLSTKQNIETKLFVWTKDGGRDGREVFLFDAGSHYNNGRTGQSETFKGRVSHFQDQLKDGNASIIIRKTKATDQGNYTCEFPLLQPQHKSHVELIVHPDPERSVLKDRSGENIPGASPELYVTILDETKDWSLLQCRVRGASPEPKVEWQDRAGNILPAEEPQVSERGGSYDVTLQVTVTKTDRYRCVATQEDIKHRITAEIHVFIGESSGLITAVLVGGIFVGVIVGVGVLLAVLVYKGCIPRNCNKGSAPETRVPLEDPSQLKLNTDPSS